MPSPNGAVWRKTGAWLVRQFVGFWRFFARPNMSPLAFVKPPLAARRGQHSRKGEKLFLEKVGLKILEIESYEDIYSNMWKQGGGQHSE